MTSMSLETWRIRARNLPTMLLVSACTILGLASVSSAFAQATPTATDLLSGLTLERDQLTQSLRADSRVTEQTKLAVLEKEIAQGRPFSSDELKKETLLAERDALKKFDRSADGVKVSTENRARLAEVNMQIALGREPTASERQQMQMLAAERNQLQLGKGAGDNTENTVKLAVLNQQIDQGKVFTPEEAKRQSLLAEQKILQQRNPRSADGVKIDTSGQTRLAEVNMQIALGREPTANERDKIQALAMERNKLQFGKTTGDRTETAVKLAVLNEQFNQGKIFTPEEAKQQSLLAEQKILQQTSPRSSDGAKVDTVGQTRLAELNMQIALGREPTPNERQQIQTLAAERNKLQFGKNTGDRTENAVKLAVLNEQFNQGKIFTPEEAKKQSLLAEQKILQQTSPRSSDGAKVDTVGQTRLAELNMQIALGREPTANERQQIQTLAAERNKLQFGKNTGDRTETAVKLAVLNEQFNQGKIFTPEEAKKQSLLAEQKILQQRSPRSSDGVKIDTSGQTRLAEVNMQIALGREPTPNERQQIQTLAAERNKLQFGKNAGDRTETAVKLAVLNEQFNQGKIFTPEEAKKQSLLAEQKILQQRSRRSSDGVKIDTSGQTRLAEVNMQIALGREPTAAERKEMQTIISERDNTKKGRPVDPDKAAKISRLSVLDKEIERRQSALPTGKPATKPVDQPTTVNAPTRPLSSAAVNGATNAPVGKTGVAFLPKQAQSRRDRTYRSLVESSVRQKPAAPTVAVNSAPKTDALVKPKDALLRPKLESPKPMLQTRSSINQTTVPKVVPPKTGSTVPSSSRIGVR